LAKRPFSLFDAKIKNHKDINIEKEENKQEYKIEIAEIMQAVSGREGKERKGK